ncbi:hypothetical protein jhhlp_002317 [Lomentospora prolificans]|uniref:DH domain-containing protein n=1 Tax=Lomentospora prolificans TaxID=41688 RepID=A0A2N3NDR9_9PEZI|nr:hypothetical protein jhhlp_002317 [Lomentospora prolificans]
MEAEIREEDYRLVSSTVNDPLSQHRRYADANSSAVTANNRAVNSIDPHDFYRSYQGADTSALVACEDDIPMATTASSRGENSSSPSNPSHASSQHAPTTSSSRAPLRQNLRSVSAPLGNDRSPATVTKAGSAGQTSVKDLRKKFDQGGSASMIPRPPARSSLIHRPTYSSRSRATTPTGGPAGSSQSSNSSSKSIVGRTQSSTTDAGRSGGPKFSQVNNGQSFANRINKPKSSSSSKSGHTKSITQASREHTSGSSSSSAVSHSRNPSHTSQPILFGEILPEQRDTLALGYGIEEALPRHPSDVDADARQRAFSNSGDAIPDSPTDWYRSENTRHGSELPTHSTLTLLSHSQDGGGLSMPSASPDSRRRPTSPNGKRPGSSRRLNSTSADMGRPTSGLPSPSYRRSHYDNKPSRTGTPMGSRAKTPTESRGSRKQPPRNIITPTNAPQDSTRLSAIISTPPPKLSPPLRSSRPRQPVSVATTTSSRLKSIDRAPKSPTKQSWKSPSSSEDKSSRRRKVSVGNIDFEQRREHVKLAYRKSIRQSRIQDAKRAAKSQPSDEADAVLEVEPRPTSDQLTIVLDGAPAEVPSLHYVPDTAAEPSTAEDSQFVATPDKVIEDVAVDSPTLGIPGSFPAMSPPLASDEIPPPSAVSTTSDMTEFDTEPQADLEGQSDHATSRVSDHFTLRMLADTGAQDVGYEDDLPTPAKAEYQYPFEEEDGDDTIDAPEQMVVEIGLDIVQTPTLPPDGVVTHNEFEPPSVPGAFKDDFEVAPYAPDPYETRVRILRRESDMSQFTGSQHSHAPFPAYDFEDGGYSLNLDGHDVLRNINHGGEDSLTDDVCSAGAQEDGDQHEAYYSPEAYLRDGTSSARASTCESFDASQPDEQQGGVNVGGLGIQRSLDSSQMLGVPSMLVSGNRSSQHSSWTDFSIDSSEPSDGVGPRSSRNRLGPSPLPKHVTAFGDSGLGGEEASLLVESGHLPPIDDHGEGLRTYPVSHQLPELDTGEGFEIPYLAPNTEEQEKGQETEVPLPSHEPPPIPTVEDQVHQTPSSSLYEQPSSTLVGSQRESEEFTLASTRASINQVSFDHTEASQHADLADGTSIVSGVDKHEPSSKDRQRLVQRRNVIKELVDTEAVFVRDMNIVEEIYKGTAEACPKLDDKTVKLIFRNTDEIISFHTTFLAELKEAVASVYQPAGRKSPPPREDSRTSEATMNSAVSHSTIGEPDEDKDRLTALGPVFKSNIDSMKTAHEGFLRNSDQAAKRLIQIQQDRTVKVWLNECNEVAKDLTAAWDLDSLLIKPMQRITKYPNLIITLLQHTPDDHPDRAPLIAAKEALETAIIEINKTKKNFELVGQIVGRKRKESDVKAGFARAFGKRVDKLQTSNNRPAEDVTYVKLRERFGDDYLRLQVVLRDVEFYTRQVSAYVHEFLQYLSSMELVMRLQASPFPEVESKWVQFNVSMRDIEKVALEQHLSRVRKTVIEPFEQVIKAYGNPSLAMKKRGKRRLDYERAEQLKRGGKTVDSKLKELVEQYEALNDTLKKELPRLSELTVKVGNICLGNLVNLQAEWFSIWKDKVKVVLENGDQMPELDSIVSAFQRDYQFALDAVSAIGIVNPSSKGRISQSKRTSTDDSIAKNRPRPTELSLRGRGPSINGDGPPSLPTPEFAGNTNASFTLSPTSVTIPSPHQYYYRDYYTGINGYRGGGASPITPSDLHGGSRSHAAGAIGATGRPSTGRSFDSAAAPRQSSESSNPNVRDSNSTSYNVTYPGPDGPRRFSGLFHSALPLPDDAEESQRSSRASSRERPLASSGYNILWLAASLFEFNIETTKHEAGYPYLVYQAGEIFDVIAEKGELWLAKNQDDPREQVGWIWSKHFAKLADS